MDQSGVPTAALHQTKKPRIHSRPLSPSQHLLACRRILRSSCDCMIELSFAWNSSVVKQLRKQFMWQQRLVICQREHKAGGPKEREVGKRSKTVLYSFSPLRPVGVVIQLHFRREKRRDGHDCYGWNMVLCCELKLHWISMSPGVIWNIYTEALCPFYIINNITTHKYKYTYTNVSYVWGR